MRILFRLMEGKDSSLIIIHTGAQVMMPDFTRSLSAESEGVGEWPILFFAGSSTRACNGTRATGG